jgi:hypothetical protein
MAKASRTVDELRSHGERSADALEAILRTGMDASELPTQARRRPRTTLHVQLETLLGMPGHGRALLERFGPVPTSTAARITCDSLVRVVLEHGARVLNVGRTHRVVTDRQHAALAATYRSCVFPGCQVRFSDRAVHHLWWHSTGGPTDLDLQLPVCESHHIWLHEGGYSITREDGRSWSAMQGAAPSATAGRFSPNSSTCCAGEPHRHSPRRPQPLTRCWAAWAGPTVRTCTEPGAGEAPVPSHHRATTRHNARPSDRRSVSPSPPAP